MFCTQCGNSMINTEARFCTKCGKEREGGIAEVAPVSTAIDSSVNNFSTSSDKKFEKESGSVWSSVAGIASFILAFALGKYLGIIVFVFLGAFWVGQWFPAWYFKNQVINYSLIKWIAWSNILTWILPPLGLMVGIGTLGFSDLVQHDGKKYKNLAIVGLVLSVANAVWGYFSNM